MGRGRTGGAAGGGAWGGIIGALADQGDLNAALRIDAAYLTANPMAALAIDTAKALNTKSVNADSTFTFSAAPVNANTYFGLILTNSGVVDRTITIPASVSVEQQANITSFVLPASAVVELLWRWDGATYRLSGEPVRRTFSFTWSFVGTTTATTYTVLLKTGVGLVITSVVSKCKSGTATATSKIDNVALGGVANAVSVTEQDQPQASANNVAIGTDLEVALTAGAVDPSITYSGYRTS